MTKNGKEKVKEAAMAAVGAGIGSAGGATVGVLELAALNAVTGLSAGVVIGASAAVGAVTFLVAYRLCRDFNNHRRFRHP